ncbi:MAG: M28 family peptidase [Gemmatimonadales bacterium]
MRSTCCLVAILLATAGTSAVAQQTHARPAAPRAVWPDETGPLKWAARPTVAAITANDLRTRLYQYADDSMMGRKVGELGDFKATTYIAREFKRLGLKPGGENGGYFQVVPYGSQGFDSTTSRLAVAGAALTPKRDWIPVTPTAANGFGGHVELDNVPTIFAGRFGDSTTSLDPSLLRGKVAVFIAPAGGGGGGRGFGGGGRGRGGAGLNACEVPGLGGAAAAIAAALARGGGGRGGRGGGRGGAPGRDPLIAAGAPAAVLLIEADLAPNAANAAFATRNGMRLDTPANVPGAAEITADAAARLFGKPVDEVSVGSAGAPVSGSWDHHWQISPTPARNVIAILPGSDPARAGEYVLLSAHNDHNGISSTVFDHDSLRAFNRVVRPQGANDPICRPTPEQQHEIDSLIARARSIRPPRRDSIMNGADDDGSGTVVLLEIAEKFAREHPARSVIFVSHTGEEGGLLGSAWFTSHPTIPLDSVAAALNMDMVGKGRVTDVPFGGPNAIQTLGSRRLSRAFGDIIDSVNAISPAPMAIDRSWDVPANPLNRFCRSDQVNYVHHDVPVTYFSTGYSIDYHQATDEPQYIDYDHAARFANWIHEIMTAIANRHDRPAISGADPSYPACR